jgi:uncharacterized RDD family membrane protein YckC
VCGNCGLALALPQPPPQRLPPPPAPPRTFGGNETAGFGYRAAAFLVDFGLALAIAVAVDLIARAAGSRDKAALGGAVVAWAAVWLLLWPLFSAITNGQTPGKRLVSIRAVRADGRRVGVGWSLLREGLFKGLLAFVPGWALLDDLWATGVGGQALHDKALRTGVTRGPRYARRGLVAVLAPSLLGALALAGVVVLIATNIHAQGGYSAAQHDAFVHSCAKGDSRGTCECVWAYLKRHLPYNRFQKFGQDYNRDPQNTHLPHEFLDAFDACAPGRQGAPPPNSS